MGDKNSVASATVDLLVKSGHGILKAVYVTDIGDKIFVIRDGVAAGGGTVLFTIDSTTAFMAPYINHPVSDGIFVDVGAGATGSIMVVFE